MILEADDVLGGHAAGIVMPEERHQCGHSVPVALIGAWLSAGRLRLAPPILDKAFKRSLRRSRLRFRFALRRRPFGKPLGLWVGRIIALGIPLAKLQGIADGKVERLKENRPRGFI